MILVNKRSKIAAIIPALCTVAVFMVIYSMQYQLPSETAYNSVILRSVQDGLGEDILSVPEPKTHHEDLTVKKRMPQAIVLGAGKCGTDALITYLNTSDDFEVDSIHRQNMGELNYFNFNYFRGTKWYIENMPNTTKDQITIEKCAPYMWNPIVPERVFLTNPEMKLIWVLCDPVKRIMSLYAHVNSYKTKYDEDPLPPFEDLVYINKTNHKLTENLHPLISQPYLGTGKYIDFLKLWLEYFPLEQMVMISGEELIDQPLAQIRKVTSFLGRPNAVTEKNLYYDENRGYFCFQKHGQRWCMDKKNKGRRHPVISDTLLKALQNHFQPYNNQLKEFTRINFGWPKYFGQKD